MSDLPRRLTIIGGFVLLGWFALAIAGATHAAASPTSPTGAAGRHQPPTISPMLRGSSARAGSPADAAARVMSAIRPAARTTTSTPATATVRPTPAGRTDAYGAAPVPLPAAAVAPSPRAEAQPPRAGSTTPVDDSTVLGDLPVVDGLAPAIERAVDPLLRPVESAVAPVLAPTSGLLAPVTRLGAAARPAVSTVDDLLAPVTMPVDDAVAQLAQPVANLTSGLASGVRPLAGVVRVVTASVLAPRTSSGPPVPVDGSPVGQGATGVVPVPSSAGALAHVSPATDPAAERLRSPTGSVWPAPSAAPVSAAAGQLDRTRVPVPLPTVPPSAPELLAIASAPGATTSNSGSGVTTLPGLSAGESWSAQRLHRLGVVESGRSRAVRNSATKPPVSPD